MPFCNNCGTDVGTAQFCSNCGKPQGKTEPFSGNLSQQVPQNQNYQFQPSSNPTSQYQTPPNGQYYQQQPPGYPPNYAGITKKPTGLTLLLIYEMLLGSLLIFIGIVFVFISQATYTMSGGPLFGNSSGQLFDQNTQAVLIITGIIIILWGAIGIAAGGLINQWSQKGYILSYIFLISTGILLFRLFFITTIAMIAFIYYFNKNLNFKNTFNKMKH